MVLVETPLLPRGLSLQFDTSWHLLESVADPQRYRGFLAARISLYYTKNF